MWKLSDFRGYVNVYNKNEVCIKEMMYFVLKIYEGVGYGGFRL